MPRGSLAFLLTAAAALLLAGCRPQAPAAPPDDLPGEAASDTTWQLVWSDEFDDAGLPDARRWRYAVGGHGWGNAERQYYTEARPENARVEDGHLVIEARREPWQGSDYTSARLLSRADWTYGRFELRARLPSGRGTWPALWMLPTDTTYGPAYWPDNGEIDIMEHVGYAPDTVHASVHTDAYNHIEGTQRTATVHVPSARSGFNTYAVEWTPREVRAFVNDSLYFTFANERRTRADAAHEEWPFDHAFHLVLNVAVGGHWGGARGVDPTIWPQRMLVDYVRVYQRPGRANRTQ